VEKQVAGLLADLNAGRFRQREEATLKLERMGPEVLPALRLARSTDLPPEARNRLDRVLAALEKKAPDPLLSEPDRLRRALRVLEELDTAASRKALKELASGAGALSRLAREALKRLESRKMP
jgi:hypothetical protein